MNIKDQESQLVFNLNLQIGFTVLVWLLVVGFIGYRLWQLRTLPESPLILGTNVPTIRQANIDTLRSSIKQVTGSNLPVFRLEPFD